MAISIKVMQSFSQNGKYYGIVLFTTSLHFLPRVGDVLHMHARPPYEVVKVIIRNSDVVLEVKEHNHIKGHLITEIPSI